MKTKNQTTFRLRQPKAILFSCLCCLLLFLTGCVNYDVGVTFNSPHNGNIVQHIKIAKQLENLDRSDVKKWLNSIEARARQLQGKVKKPNSEELLVTIPFRNGREFTAKFNQLFHSDIPVTSAIATETNSDVTKLDSQIALQQSNLILLERNSLNLSIDLRALDILGKQQKILVDRDSLIDLEFTLDTPGIAYAVSGENSLQPVAHSFTKPLVWQLKPGEINYLQAVFWLPSPLGLGAVAISLLMLLGFYLKYRRLPGRV